MQHVHVKRKEQTMNRYVMEEFYRDPALLDRLMLKAHRERARAMGDGLAWLLGRAKTLLSPRLHVRPGQWLERLG